MAKMTLSMAGGRVFRCEYSYVSGTVLSEHWQQLESRPGLYALLTDWVLQQELRPWEVSALLQLGFRDQLIQMRLPKLPGLAGLLDRLRFVTLDSDDVQRFRFWLQGINEIPRRLLHLPEVPFEYLDVVMREPLLALLPALECLAVELDDEEAIAELGQLANQYWKLSREMERTEKAISTRLGKLRSVKELDELVQATKLNHWRHCMRRDQVQVPVPLKPAGSIVVPRTLTDFERLGSLQKNCVAQYFTRALKGESAVYAVRDHSRVVLTAELVENHDDGLWYPVQVLATQNTLPFTRHVRELMHWLAMSQATDDEEHSYYCILLRLMRWTSDEVITRTVNDLWTDHWEVLTNVLAGLINERVNTGYAEQVSLSLEKNESPLMLEKMRRRQRSTKWIKLD